MILITGGAFQGKLNYAFLMLNEETDRLRYADGVIDPFESAYEKKIVYGFQEYVRRLLAEGKDVEEFIQHLITQNPEAVVVMNEMGCGIVPVDATDRNFREACGRAAQKLAAYSDTVYRVVCGIGMRIK